MLLGDVELDPTEAALIIAIAGNAVRVNEHFGANADGHVVELHGDRRVGTDVRDPAGGQIQTISQLAGTVEGLQATIATDPRELRTGLGIGERSHRLC
jgi:hypothetical protein